MTYQFGSPADVAVTATTYSVPSGKINLTVLVTPNASNTTITLPAAGNAGSTVRIYCDNSTAVDRYCDIVVAASGTMKCPPGENSTSSYLKKIRIWKPGDVVMIDNGSKWISDEGSVWIQQPWFNGETEGTLGWGLYECIPGTNTGFGVRGLFKGTTFAEYACTGATLSQSTSAIETVREVDGSGNLAWFGQSIRPQSGHGLFTRNTDLILSGTAKQFIVVDIRTISTFTSLSGYTRFYGQEQQQGTYAGSLYFIGNTSDEIVPIVRQDGSTYSAEVITATNDTPYLMAWGFDETGNGYYSLNGSTPTAFTDYTAATAVDDLEIPIGIGNSTYAWSATCGAHFLAAWHYHGRSRWSAAEATEFFGLKYAQKGKVFIDRCVR